MAEIHAYHPQGFHVVFTDVAKDKIDAAVAWLLEHSYTAEGTSDGWRKTPDGLPICPKHGTAMSRRERQGDVWFSHKVIHPETGEEHFCRGYPYPASKNDGYDI